MKHREGNTATDDAKTRNKCTNLPILTVPRASWEEERNYLLLPGNARLRLAWSNKYAPSEDFFIIDRRWARWIAKPSFSDRFQIVVNPEGEKLDAVFRTVYQLTVEHPEAVRRFTPEWRTFNSSSSVAPVGEV